MTNCHQLKMQAADGKFYFTDVADTETLLRLIQSIPSPKAEPFKLWLASRTSDSHPGGDRPNDEKQEIEPFEGLLMTAQFMERSEHKLLPELTPPFLGGARGKGFTCLPAGAKTPQGERVTG